MKNPRVPIITLRINDLIDYLNKQDGPMTSRKYEFHSSVILAKFMSAVLAEEQWIAFPAKERMRNEFDRARSMEDLGAILNEFGESDAPQDVYLIPNSESDKRNERMPQGHGYQLKHVFPRTSDISMEDQLIEYLNKIIPNKYGKAVNTGLVLLMSTEGAPREKVNLGRVRRELKTEEFPFDSILLITGQSDESVAIASLWPSFGARTFSPEEFYAL